MAPRRARRAEARVRPVPRVRQVRGRPAARAGHREGPGDPGLRGAGRPRGRPRAHDRVAAGPRGRSRVMRRVVVTGVAGRIGSYVARALVERGDTVVGVDDLSTGDRRNLAPLVDDRRFRLEENDILDRERMEAACAGADTLVHLAARADGGATRTLERLDVHARGTEIALACAARERARFVFASSGLAPREADDLVLGDPQLRSWCDAAAKVYGEHLCFGYAEKHGLSIAILRYAGVYDRPSAGRHRSIGGSTPRSPGDRSRWRASGRSVVDAPRRRRGPGDDPRGRHARSAGPGDQRLRSRDRDVRARAPRVAPRRTDGRAGARRAPRRGAGAATARRLEGSDRARLRA